MRTTGRAGRGTVLARVALALLAAVALLLPGATTAGAATAAGPVVHHVLPENGVVLAASPDHVEVMFGEDLVPGRVEVGVAPDATGRLVALPAPQVDGPLVVQPLPPLPAGAYTVGVRVVDAAGRAAQGTFGFTVDPSAPAPTAAPAGDGTDGSRAATWLVPLASTVLLLPAVALALRRRGRQRWSFRPPPHGRAGPPADPGCATGRTPTSASSPADRRGR